MNCSSQFRMQFIDFFLFRFMFPLDFAGSIRNEVFLETKSATIKKRNARRDR